MRRFVTPLIILCLLFTLASCGKTNNGNSLTPSTDQFGAVHNTSKTAISEIWRYNSDGYWLCCKFDYIDENCRITKYQAPGVVGREYVFNSNGDILCDQVYSTDGEIEQMWDYEYHSNGVLAREREYRGGYLKRDVQYDIFGQTIATVEYKKNTDYISYQAEWLHEYDQNGNLLKSYKDGNLEHESTFDEYGNEILRKNYAKYRGTWSLSSVWEYQYEGNLKVIARSYNADMVLKQEKRYSYNGDKLFSEETYNGNGSLKERLNYLYDSNDNLYSITGWSEESGDSTAYVKEYDMNNRIIKDIEYNNGKEFEITSYEYDANGNCVQILRYIQGVLKYSWGYQYNSAGQKTEEKYYVSDELHRWEKIEYAADGLEIINVDMLTYGDSSTSPDASYKYDNHAFFRRVLTETYDYPFESYIKILENNSAILMF